MRGIGAFLAMLSFGVGFRAQNQPPIPEDTATMIYSAAISQASLSGIKQFLIVADTTPQADVACPNSIISESEFGKRLAESRSEGQKAPRYDFGDAVPDADYDSYVEARQDYHRANQTSDLLPSRLDLLQRYRLISKDEASNLIHDTNVPYGQSIFWVSAIGFSQDQEPRTHLCREARDRFLGTRFVLVRLYENKRYALATRADIVSRSILIVFFGSLACTWSVNPFLTCKFAV